MKPHSLALAALVALVPLVIGAAGWSCSSGEEPDGGAAADGGPPLEDYLAREVAAALFSEDEREASWRALQPLIERPDALPEDLLRGAIVRLAADDVDGAEALLERVREPLAADPALHYNLGRLAFLLAEFEAARDHYARAHELAPDDYPAQLALANVLFELDELEAAERHYAALLARGFEEAGSWHLTTLYRTSRLMRILGRGEEADELTSELNELKGRGFAVPQGIDIDRGNFGRLLPPPSIGTRVAAPAALGALAAADRRDDLLPEIAGFELVDLGDAWPGATGGVGPTGVVAWGPGGLRVTSLGTGPSSFLHRVTDEPVELVEPLDLENDGDLDLLVAGGGALRLFLWDGSGSWVDSGLELPAPPSAVLGAVAVDHDHEGDLDLALVGDFGFRLLRNDGAGLVADGRFTDVTAETGIPSSTAFAWCVAEDLDTDQDVDLLLGGPGGAHLADSLRGGRFADESEGLPAELAAELAAEGPPLVADLDGDARPDLVVLGAEPRVFAARGVRAWRELERWSAGSAPLAGSARLADLDLDGAADLVWSEAEGTGAVRLAAGLPAATAAGLAGPDLPAGALCDVADLDADARSEVVAAGGGALRAFELPASPNRALKVVLRGVKDNRRGVGAVLEVRAGEIYRRVYWRGRAEVIGLGDREQADVVRVTWPNGIVQTLTDVPAGGTRVIEQKEGLVGSCPFLYTWNGETYEYVSDVLGITPLGLPMAPGLLVPPDHDEYVLVRGDQLAPRELADGTRVFELQITEELREVTYLDRVRLDVVDHPAGTEVYPNERFTFPPFPEAHTHTVRDPLPPLSATGSDGRDWTAALARVDDDLARPFEAYSGQFLGLAEPHWLELEFDREAVAAAEGLRLLCTGWLYWTDASVNVAVSAVPGVEFVPPVLSVPDGEGGWRDAGPPVGFPAGKTKTMVLDVADVLDPADPRLRVSTTLRLYWDAIRLAVDGDDAPLRVTSIEPSSARLWERGFSEPIPMHGTCRLDWFEWDGLEVEPRWNQHPGEYTRLGETLPLVTEVDDRFVILGAGDALTVRFDADAAPPLPEGWVRDYLVFLDGWAKDRDPNSVEALYVEPLPFHGMTSYPYGPDEHFPDTDEHRRWRAEWNTREARRWIAPLAEERVPPILQVGPER